MKARIIIGACLGDEGKGTVVARYAKNAGKTLNVLTNGGSQRGHSVMTESGDITYHHFGSGTHLGADNYYSRFYILNPMQFALEYNAMLVKPGFVGYDKDCMWSTMYDMLANVISNEAKNAHGTCGMGIWNTITRYRAGIYIPFGDFMKLEEPRRHMFLDKVRTFYENKMTVPEKFRNIWYNYDMVFHFLKDCEFMHNHIKECSLDSGMKYDTVIFENGQGLMLTDTGEDRPDRTPSDTGISYGLSLAKDMRISDADITAHYVTRPYLTRHGDGCIDGEASRGKLSADVKEDRHNVWNEFQGGFRYGKLDIGALKNRIDSDRRGTNYEIELTHCDEMDRTAEFRKAFGDINAYDSPLV